MPMYEYRCRACERQFEQLGSMERRDEAVECPSCGEQRASRQFSVFAAFGTSDGRTTSLGGCCGGGGGGCACRA